MSLWLLFDAATSSPYSTEDPAPIVMLLIYSIVCIIKEIREKEDSLFGYENPYTDYHTYDYTPSNTKSNWVSNSGGYDRHNEWLDKYGSVSTKRIGNDKVEVFAPNKKEESVKEERPLVYHVPSKKEARDKIAELEKDWKWRLKRGLCSFIGIDITEKYYKPHYVKESPVVKAIKKEDHSRFMPNNEWQARKIQEENEAYNKVTRSLSRSCDIAFEDESFVEEITVINNESKSSNPIINYICEENVKSK